MSSEANTWMEKKMFILVLIASLIILNSYRVLSVPTAPSITYISNTTYTSGTVNRSTDAKGTITTVILSSTQQDYKWKAYVGNASGRLALADANAFAIYDWSTGTVTGEIYVSRFSNINWNNISCANQTAVDNEQSATGMVSTSADSINATFNATNHLAFNVGTTPISGCRSTATYINGTAQNMGSAATFQEILIKDNSTQLVYATLINASSTGYNNQVYDFQLIVAENESATTPFTYYFWVELG
jgi:hypothetical protein